MIKRLFDWTPSDIAYWEKLRERGLLYFIGWYGVLISGGVLFLVFGIVTLIIWIGQISWALITPLNWIFLGFKLMIVAVVCLIAGIANSLITWVVEERLYRKYKRRE